MRSIIACAAAMGIAIVCLGTATPAEARKGGGLGSKVLTAGAKAGAKAAVRGSRRDGASEDSDDDSEAPARSREAVESITPVVAPAPAPAPVVPAAPLKVNDITCLAGCYK